MSYHDPALLRQELAFHKARGLGFDRAWLLTMTVVPQAPTTPGIAESLEYMTYRVMREAYIGEGKPCGLTRECAADAEAHGHGGRGKSRPSRLVA